MSALTVVSVIRNGVANGYPFVEAYGSWTRFADRILVVDGRSTDGTDRVLDELATLVPQLEIVSRPWPATSVRGSAIADLTTEAVELAGDGGSRLLYVQADEVFDEPHRNRIRSWEDGALELGGCEHFWNSLDRVLATEVPMRYVRGVPPGVDAAAIADGYTLTVADEVPVELLPDRFLHYGWCFPVNILQKHVNHARLYPESIAYGLRGRLAGMLLAAQRYDGRSLDALAPHYEPVPFRGEHPACMRHLVGRNVYDPYVGLDLLAAGAEW